MLRMATSFGSSFSFDFSFFFEPATAAAAGVATGCMAASGLKPQSRQP